jgi:hypothetical protein
MSEILIVAIISGVAVALGLLVGYLWGRTYFPWERE